MQAEKFPESPNLDPSVREEIEGIAPEILQRFDSLRDTCIQVNGLTPEDFNEEADILTEDFARRLLISHRSSWTPPATWPKAAG